MAWQDRWAAQNRFNRMMEERAGVREQQEGIRQEDIERRNELNAMIAGAMEKGEDVPFTDEQANVMYNALNEQERAQMPEFQGSAPDMVAKEGEWGVNMPKAYSNMMRGGRGLSALKLQQEQAKGRSLGKQPSAIEVFEYMEGLAPKAQERMLTSMRAPKYLDVGSGYVSPTQLDPTRTRPVAERELAPTERPSYIEEKVTTQKGAELQAKKLAAKPKAKLAMGQVEQRSKRLGTAIAKAKEQSSAWTVGAASATKWMPGTPAHDLSKTLQTIRANIGFDALNAMRASSPTGGALGQVSERELGFLQSVLANLEQSQSPSQLDENLGIAEQQINESWKRIAEAYQTDYGKPMEAARDLAGITETGQVIPDEPKKYKSYAKKGTQRIGSDDGVTWFDVTTGEEVK